MQNNHEGSNRSPETEDRGVSGAQTNSHITITSEPFAQQFDEIERLLNDHRGALNTGGLHGHSPALDGEGEENNAGDEEKSDAAVTDPERGFEQQCNEMDNIDRRSLFDSFAKRRRTEKLRTALERSFQKSSPLIERDCRTEDGPPYDDNPGQSLNNRIKAFREEAEELRYETQVFKARLKEANEIVHRISKAPGINKVETLAQLKEAIERVARIKREMEKAAAKVRDDKLHRRQRGRMEMRVRDCRERYC